jgi:hypothetical protein
MSPREVSQTVIGQRSRQGDDELNEIKIPNLIMIKAITKMIILK